MSDPDPDSPLSSLRGGLCKRTGCSLYGVAEWSRKIFSKRKSERKKEKKRKIYSGAVWGIILQQQLQPPLHPNVWHSLGGMGISEPKCQAQGECSPPRDLRPHSRHQGEFAPQKASLAHPQPPGGCLPEAVGPGAT